MLDQSDVVYATDRAVGLNVVGYARPRELGPNAVVYARAQLVGPCVLVLATAPVVARIVVLALLPAAQVGTAGGIPRERRSSGIRRRKDLSSGLYPVKKKKVIKKNVSKCYPSPKNPFWGWVNHKMYPSRSGWSGRE